MSYAKGGLPALHESALRPLDAALAAWAVGQVGRASAWAQGTAAPAPDDRLGAALLAMPVPAWRWAVVARHLFRQDTTTAARALGVKPSTFRPLVGRAYAFLAGYLAGADR